MNIIFQINGGIGKVIAGTAICASIKSKYPNDKLIVVSGYPEVFLGNPNVDRAYAFGQQQYFYQEYIEKTEDTELWRRVTTCHLNMTQKRYFILMRTTFVRHIT